MGFFKWLDKQMRASNKISRERAAEREERDRLFREERAEREKREWEALNEEKNV